MISSTDKGSDKLSLLASVTLESSGDDGSFDRNAPMSSFIGHVEEDTSLATSVSDLQGTTISLPEEQVVAPNSTKGDEKDEDEVSDHVWGRNSAFDSLTKERSFCASISAESDLRGTTFLPSSSFSTASNYDSSKQQHQLSSSVTSNSRSSSKQQLITTSAPVDLDEQEDAMIRILAGQLTREWRSRAIGAPALERRVRDFRFAQGKRRDKYEKQTPMDNTTQQRQSNIKQNNNPPVRRLICI
mmetsp:Transcript_23496/g.33720  ORF Transcript_23496/g.33720 Transcript_23496/m.33720 type:complete len:243 (+) Transcript_23496:52-780(+)